MGIAYLSHLDLGQGALRPGEPDRARVLSRVCTDLAAFLPLSGTAVWEAAGHGPR